jgi:hypothetical protein
MGQIIRLPVTLPAQGAGHAPAEAVEPWIPLALAGTIH